MGAFQRGYRITEGGVIQEEWCIQPNDPKKMAGESEGSKWVSPSISFWMCCAKERHPLRCIGHEEGHVSRILPRGRYGESGIANGEARHSH